MNAATVSGPFGDDQRIELGGKPRRELLFALAVLRETVVMRTGGMQKPGSGSRSRGDCLEAR
jgi:hypothetical protein